MRKSALLAAFPLMAMAALSPDDPIYRMRDDETTSGEFSGEKYKVCPKGCNHYRFNSMGKFTVNKPMDFAEYGECIFECFAINDKSAIKKFKKRV